MNNANFEKSSRIKMSELYSVYDVAGMSDFDIRNFLRRNLVNDRGDRFNLELQVLDLLNEYSLVDKDTRSLLELDEFRELYLNSPSINLYVTHLTAVLIELIKNGYSVESILGRFSDQELLLQLQDIFDTNTFLRIIRGTAETSPYLILSFPIDKSQLNSDQLSQYQEIIQNLPEVDYRLLLLIINNPNTDFEVLATLYRTNKASREFLNSFNLLNNLYQRYNLQIPENFQIRSFGDIIELHDLQYPSERYNKYCLYHHSLEKCLVSAIRANQISDLHSMLDQNIEFNVMPVLTEAISHNIDISLINRLLDLKPLTLDNILELIQLAAEGNNEVILNELFKFNLDRKNVNSALFVGYAVSDVDKLSTLTLSLDNLDNIYYAAIENAAKHNMKNNIEAINEILIPELSYFDVNRYRSAIVGSNNLELISNILDEILNNDLRSEMSFIESLKSRISTSDNEIIKLRSRIETLSVEKEIAESLEQTALASQLQISIDNLVYGLREVEDHQRTLNNELINREERYRSARVSNNLLRFLRNQMDLIFTNSAKSGKTEVIEWLVDNYGNEKIFPSQYGKYLILAAKYDNTNYIEWLLSHTWYDDKTLETIIRNLAPVGNFTRGIPLDGTQLKSLLKVSNSDLLNLISRYYNLSATHYRYIYRNAIEVNDEEVARWVISRLPQVQYEK